uniref:Uncharacterized protein n=1 Tax=Castor canadensis TaxID=51338 RepID=A0A8C0WTI5_CASCN
MFLFLFFFFGNTGLLGSEVVDVQGHAPAVSRLPDLRDAAAELAAERAAVDGRGHGHGRGALGGGQRANVARPAAGPEPLRPLLGQPGQAEGLIEKPAVSGVPVPERIPAGTPQEGERHSALGHGGSGSVLPIQDVLGLVAPGCAFMGLQPGIFSKAVLHVSINGNDRLGAVPPLTSPPLHSSLALQGDGGAGGARKVLPTSGNFSCERKQTTGTPGLAQCPLLGTWQSRP